MMLDGGLSTLLPAGGLGGSAAATVSAFGEPGDDAGDTPEYAGEVVLGADGAGSRAGAVERPDDVDVYRVVPPLTGVLAVRQDAAPGSGLDSDLALLDASGAVVAANDDAPGAFPGSRVDADVVAGRTYYVRAAASLGLSTGGYILTFTTAAEVVDDAGDTPEYAGEVVLGADGAGSRAGAVERPDDVDVYRVVPPLTGVLAVRQDAAPGSGLDSDLALLDASGAVVAANDDAPGAFPGSRVDADVVAGRTYYVRAAASPHALEGRNTGAYALSFNQIPAVQDEREPNDETATALAIAPSSRVTAALGAGDVDFYRIAPVESGSLTARVQSGGAPPGCRCSAGTARCWRSATASSPVSARACSG